MRSARPRRAPASATRADDFRPAARRTGFVISVDLRRALRRSPDAHGAPVLGPCGARLDARRRRQHVRDSGTPHATEAQRGAARDAGRADRRAGRRVDRVRIGGRTRRRDGHPCRGGPVRVRRWRRIGSCEAPGGRGRWRCRNRCSGRLHRAQERFDEVRARDPTRNDGDARRRGRPRRPGDPAEYPARWRSCPKHRWWPVRMCPRRHVRKVSSYTQTTESGAWSCQR